MKKMIFKVILMPIILLIMSHGTAFADSEAQAQLDAMKAQIAQDSATMNDNN